MHWMRTSMMLTLLLAGCGGAKTAAPPPQPARSMVVDPAATRNEIAKAVPVGTSLSVGQATMQTMGFTCSFVQGGSFGGRTNIDYVRCERSEVLNPGLVRQWHVALVGKDGAVSEVLLTYELASRVQAREASQLPAKAH